MEAPEILSAFRNADGVYTLQTLHSYVKFKPVTTEEGEMEDENLEVRSELTRILLFDYSQADIELIRMMFRAELECERATWRHDSLYQLSFYLYSLGQMEDSLLLYEAKYESGHMDCCTMQDRYSITVGHEPTEVMKYVEDRFQKDPGLRHRYSGLLEQLQDIIDHPEYDSVADYSRFIHDYFL